MQRLHAPAQFVKIIFFSCFCYFYKVSETKEEIEVIIPFNNKKLKNLAKRKGNCWHHIAFITKKKPKIFTKGAKKNMLIFFEKKNKELVYYEKN